MNNRKLPVTEIFIAALSLPLKHTRALLKVGAPLVVTFALLWACAELLGSSEYLHKGKDIGWEGVLGWKFGVMAVLGLMFFLALITAIIGCHRTFLMDPKVTERANFLGWTGNELKFVGWWILIAICTILVAIPLLLFLSPFLAMMVSNIIENSVILLVVIGALNIPIYYFVSRWSLVLPSCAIGIHGKSLTWGWRLSDGNGLRLLFLVGFLPFTWDLLLSLLPEFDSILYSLFTWCIWMVVGVIEIGLLSLSYAYLVSNERDEDAIEGDGVLIAG